MDTAPSLIEQLGINTSIRHIQRVTHNALFIGRLSQRRAWTEYFREFLSIIALWECCKYVLWDTSLKNNSSESDVNIEMLELPTLVHILALGSRSDRFIPRACKKTDS